MSRFATDPIPLSTPITPHSVYTELQQKLRRIDPRVPSEIALAIICPNAWDALNTAMEGRYRHPDRRFEDANIQHLMLRETPVSWHPDCPDNDVWLFTGQQMAAWAAELA